MRPSRTSRWRAATLIGVHLAVALHVAHWYLTGRTLTPVEPSETMQTLGSQALLNAGCVFFAVAILSTLIFGRFFCGWGCHIVALQDLCGWILRRLGIAPKPFRSRLLVFMPLAAAVFMFVVPTATRLWNGGHRAALQPHFTTEKFWATFPDWPIALLTFGVCGFLIVYVLGNKGFCTYGCPYGGIFGLADKIAPGKIRVTSDCEGCGHCTAVCTSNVRVHEEVRDFGMVVNPGCMKCMDCISVCPKDALYFGFGLPSVANRKAPEKKVRHFDYTWPEEIALLVLFVLSAATFRALYDAVPLLLALGLAAITAYSLLTALRLTYQPSVSLGRLRLRADRRLTFAGIIFRVASCIWVVFLIHSGVVQYLYLVGTWRFESAQAQQASLGYSTPEIVSLAQAGRDSLDRCRRIGLDVPTNLLVKLAAACALADDPTSAERFYHQALEQVPGLPSARFELAQLALKRGDRNTAIQHLRIVIEEEPTFPRAAGVLANLLLEGSQPNDALTMIEALIQRFPDFPDFQLTKGLVFAHLGRLDEAVAVTQAAIERWPDNADAHFNLGAMLANQGKLENALQQYEKVARLTPTSGVGHFMCAKVALRLSKPELVFSHLDDARRLEPYNAEYVTVWAMALKQAGHLESAIAEAQRDASLDRAARFRLVILLRTAGRTQEADVLAAEFGDLPGPRPNP